MHNGRNRMESEPPWTYSAQPDSLSDKDSRYRMDHPRRGVAAIFNQERFDNSVTQRKGSQLDCASLNSSFCRLGFDVETYMDMTLGEIKTSLEDLSERDHSDCDCFTLVFMSHGLEGKLRARDQLFDINLLWDCFTAERSPTLANKPKIFIIQACQGHGRQSGTYVSRLSLEDANQSPEEHVKLVPSYLLPDRADFLVALSSIPGFVSWRNPERGSWYIQTLCSHLDSYGFEQDILTLLTNVNREVALQFTFYDPKSLTKKKQLPSFISMLIRELKFSQKTKRRSKRTLRDTDNDSDMCSLCKICKLL